MIIVAYVLSARVVVGAVGVGRAAVFDEFTGRAGAHEAGACLGAWVAVITGHVVHDQVAVGAAGSRLVADVLSTGVEIVAALGGTRLAYTVVAAVFVCTGIVIVAEHPSHGRPVIDAFTGV